MIPQRIDPLWTPEGRCAFEGKWKLHPELSSKLQLMASKFPVPLNIISGHRSLEQQQQLIDEGKGAPLHLSNHVTCPSTAADLWPVLGVTDVVKAQFGEAAVSSGLRWGGGSPVDPETGIPSDWNHVDLGPRSQ